MVKDTDIRLIPKIAVLLEDDIDKFNRMVENGTLPDLRKANLAGLDLRRARLAGLDLSGCYFRGADLSGADLTGCNLEGASFRGAHVSGVWFPDNVTAEEIRLSVDLGTRIRVKKQAG